MDETADEVGDSSERKRSSKAGSRSKSSSRKKPAHASRTQQARVTDTAPPRRWWEQPWLWFATIVVVVGGSLGVSYAVNTDPEDITPVGDTSAFCSAIKTYREKAGEVNIGLDVASEDMTRIRNDFAAVQNAAPPEIRPTVDDLATRNLDATVAGMRELQSQPDSLDRVKRSEDLLLSIENNTKRSSDRYERYVSRACGIDLSQPLETTSTMPANPQSVPPSPPSAPSSPISNPLVSTTIVPSASTTVGG